MAASFLPVPESLKEIQHFLNVASEHDNRDLTVSYWCRLHALNKALPIYKKSEDGKAFVLKLMDWLENEKKTHGDNETIVNETAAQAYIETCSLKLFQWADAMDRSSVFNKNVVKAFYTASILMEVLQTFGEVAEDMAQNTKYAKWKAAYIHNCLKTGEIPVPGPPNTGKNPEGPSQSTIESHPSEPPPPANSTLETPDKNFTSNPPAAPIASVSSSFTTDIPSQPAVEEPEQEINYIEPELINKCQKFIKFASSALNYDDYKEAKLNLVKALNILNSGK